MTESRAAQSIGCPICAASTGLVTSIFRAASRMPYAALAIPLRVAVATVFWNSAMTKLANWNTAIDRAGREADGALDIWAIDQPICVANESG